MMIIPSQAERKMMAAGISGPEGHAMAHPEVLYCPHLDDGNEDLCSDYNDYEEGVMVHPDFL